MNRKRMFWFVIAVVLLGVAFYLWGSNSTPLGQPELVSLNQTNAMEFEQSFNAASASMRIVLLVSPTVRVFVVWEPMLPSDWYHPTRPTLKRVSDSRAVQFWDKNHLVAAEVKQQLQQFHGSHPNCCENGGHLWDMAAVYPPGVRWGESAPAYDDGPVYKIAPELNKRLTQILNGKKDAQVQK